MKFLKLGVFAMALGLFAVSCADNTTTDDTATTPETEMEAPATEDATVPPVTDTAATTVDTTAPAAE